ncbi:MAG: ABC transporter permease [Mycoplasmoidaceae bacterium]
MQKKKIIIKSIIKFFTKNLFSVIGMIMLVLFSSAIFTSLNNATNNLNASYERVTKNGNLHDFVINERFTLGNSSYALVPNSGSYNSSEKTYSYKITPITGPNSTNIWTNSYSKIFNDYQSWKINGETSNQFFSQNKFLFEENTFVSIGHETIPSDEIINDLVSASIEDQLSKLETLTINYMPIQYISDIENKTPTSLRNFRSINIPTNKQNIFYKVIETDRKNIIDKIVLFEGKNLSDVDEAFSGIFQYYSDLPGDKSSDIKVGKKIIEILANVDWTNTSRNNQYNAFDKILKEKPDANPWTISIPFGLPNSPNGLARSGQSNFKRIINNKLYKEKAFSITFDENSLIPLTGIIEDKSSYEAVVTPQYLSKHKKEIFSHSEWMLHQNDSQNDFLKWFETIDEKFKISIDSIDYIILGSGLSPDFIYPVLSNQRIIPNLETEVFFYTNSAGFLKVQDSFRNSELETMILGKFNDNVKDKSAVLQQINNLSRTLMDWPSNMQAAFFVDDLNNIITPSALRVVYIPNVMNIITLVSYFLTSFITVISIVISILFIKRFLDLNKVNLGVLQANGYKKWDIVLPMIICMGLLIIIGTTVGFTLGLILQSPAMLIFQNFWTLPVKYTAFNAISFSIFVIGLVLFYALITFIITLFSLKGDNVYLMKSDAQYKGNLLSQGSKKILKSSNPLNKFRVSLAYHSISKLLLLSIMTSLVMTSLIFASSTYGKFDDARISTFGSKQYKYDLKLFSPTNVSGQYYGVPINSIGMTLVEGKYENMKSYTSVQLDSFISENPQASLITVGDVNNGGPYYVYSEIIDNNDSTIKNPTFNTLYENGNWHLPSTADLTNQNRIDYLKEKSQNRTLLDVSILGNNPWEIAARLMPSNQKNYADNSFKDLLSSLTIDNSTFEIIELTGSSKTGTFNPEQKVSVSLKKFTDNSTENDPNAFKNLFVDEDDLNDYLVLSKRKIMSGFSSTLINHEFVSLMLHAYNNIDSANKNYTINYNKVPLMTDGENILDETYTNIDFSIKENKGQSIDIPSNKFSMNGIKENTKFVSLSNSENINLIDKLIKFEYDPIQKLYPIIINKFTSRNFNLREKDTIKIKVNNHIDRYENDVPNSNFEFDLIIVGISESFQNNEFFTLQEYANELTGMNTLKKNFKDHNNPELDSDEPFNAIFSNSEELVQITNTISLYSPSGLYPKEDRTDNNSFYEILQKTNYSNLIKASEITGIDYEIIIGDDINNPILNSLQANEKLEIAKKFQENIVKKYGEQTYVSLIDNIVSIDALLSLFQNVSDTANFIEITILLIIVLVSTIIIGLMIHMLISDSLKIAGMMKILGLKNTTNAFSFMSIYFVAIVAGVIISIPLSFFVNFLYVKIIFDATSILLIAPILIADYAIAEISVIAFFFLAFLLNWRKIKKLDLTKNIK